MLWKFLHTMQFHRIYFHGLHNYNFQAEIIHPAINQ